MKFTFTEKKMEASENLRAYAEKKAGKIDRLFRNESEAFVTFSTERGRFLVELTIKNNGTYFRAHELTSDMYASVDSAVATIERQIRKNKTRLARRIRQDAFVRSAEAETSFVPDVEDTEEYKLIRIKQFTMMPMSRDEAILQMNLLGHNFFAFRDEDAEGAFAVVYRRNDGDYGLLEDVR